MRTIFGVLALMAILVSACGSSGTENGEAGSSSGAGASTDQRFPNVQEVKITTSDDGTYTLDVTMSSPYDSPERYADGWRVLTPDGDVLGEHELTHDHASEQPFTRTHTGLEIPVGIETVTVEGRDTANGYGGGAVEVDVPQPTS